MLFRSFEFNTVRSERSIESLWRGGFDYRRTHQSAKFCCVHEDFLFTFSATTRLVNTSAIADLLVYFDWTRRWQGELTLDAPRRGFVLSIRVRVRDH